MKILMVNKFLYPNGGSETYMFKLGEYLSSIGHQVEYFGMEHRDRCVSNSAEQYTSGMDFHTANALDKLKYSLKTIYSKEAREKLNTVLDHFQPDVVHLNNFNFQLTPSIIYAVEDFDKRTGRKTKLVYTAHDSQLICPNHMMYNNENVCEKCLGGNFSSCTKNKCIHGSTLKSLLGTFEAKLYNSKNTYDRIDNIICCSEFIKTKLDTNPLFKNKTVTLHNFIDSVDKKQTEKKDYILYFGRFSKEKGIETLIRAKNINFICAGAGPLEEQVNAAPNLTNVGFKTGAELEQLIREAKLSVFPSVCYENCPFSVMESIMYGTPVVASAIGGIPELVDDGKTGFLFEAGNAEKMIEAINKIDSSTMSQYCLDKDFDTVETYCTKLMAIYQS